MSATNVAVAAPAVASVADRVLLVARRAAGTVASAAKAGRVIEIKRRDYTMEQVDAADQKELDGQFSDARQEALELLATYAEDIRYAIETKRAAIMECVAIMFPSRKISKATWAQHKAAGQFLRARSEYGYKEYKRAVKLHFGALPKADGSKGDKAGARQSPKLWARGLETDMAKLAERIGKMPSKDIDKQVARQFIAAFKEWNSMIRVINKAIND